MNSCEITDAIEYFPETGLFVWKISSATYITVGSVAGTVDKKGYRRITYRGHRYMAHRVAWLLMTGKWPAAEIDHRNCNPSDNRWCNLREATPTQNQANRRGLGKYQKGVRLHRGGKFEARIRVNGKQRHLGTFKTAEEAATAYAIAAKQYFGEFARIA